MPTSWVSEQNNFLIPPTWLHFTEQIFTWKACSTCSQWCFLCFAHSAWFTKHHMVNFLYRRFNELTSCFWTSLIAFQGWVRNGNQPRFGSHKLNILRIWRPGRQVKIRIRKRHVLLSIWMILIAVTFVWFTLSRFRSDFKFTKSWEVSCWDEINERIYLSLKHNCTVCPCTSNRANSNWFGISINYEDVGRTEPFFLQSVFIILFKALSCIAT